MSATGLDVFDKTLQTTHIWLDDVMESLGPDRKTAWRALSSVLRALRDRLPVDLAAHFGAELPLLVRGAYYDQYRPGAQPVDCRNLEAFEAMVAEKLSDIRPLDPKATVEAVFGVISRHVPEGQVAKVREALPATMRAAWESVEDRTVAAGPEAQKGESDVRPLG